MLVIWFAGILLLFYLIKNIQIIFFIREVNPKARATGFEPVSTVLETAILPLNYARKIN